MSFILVDLYFSLYFYCKKKKKMSRNPKEGKLLYHITAIKNLKSILEKGILPRNRLKAVFKDVASSEILEKRHKYDLEDFVPFHFFAKSPFAGSVQKANGKETFVYLAVHRKLAIEKKFMVVPSHPLNYQNEPLEMKEGMNAIDWELMAKRDYKDHDCKEVCLAECIYEGVIDPKDIWGIFVENKEIYKETISLVKEYNLDTQVIELESIFIKK